VLEHNGHDVLEHKGYSMKTLKTRYDVETSRHARV
jgi:hypothetical protein